MRWAFDLFGLHIVFSIGFITMTIQLLIAEIIFLHSYKRKNRFVLRCILSILFCLLVAITLHNIFPVSSVRPTEPMDIFKIEMHDFTRIIVIILSTILSAKFCFDEKWMAIIAACMAGYVVQHFSFKFGSCIELFTPIKSFLGNTLKYHIVTLLLYYGPWYIIAYFLFARSARKNGYKNEGDPFLNILSFAIIFMLIIVNRLLSATRSQDVLQRLADNLYAMMCCSFALILQFIIYRHIHLTSDYNAMELMLHENKRQYKLWKNSLDEINIRYHDLRHEIEFLKSLEGEAYSELYKKMEQTLDDYSIIIHTGNDVLDVLLSSKKSLCRMDHIEFSCMVESGALDSFDGMSMYALFNNAIDNAVDYLKKQEVNNRSMSLRVKKMGEYVAICVENYFVGQLNFRNGLPQTTRKGSWHGYGMRSIKRIVDNLHGTMTIQTEDKAFRLTIMLPFQNTNSALTHK